MQPAETLKSLGLTDKEAAVYLALLQLGRASAYAIAIKSGLKRPTTYIILDQLITKGAVHLVPRAKKQLYVALAPEKLLEAAKQKLDLAQSGLVNLKALTKKSPQKLNSLYFEGSAGMRQAVEYNIKDVAGRDYVGFYAAIDDPNNESYQVSRDWAASLKKNRISIRGITPDTPAIRKFVSEHENLALSFKFLPQSAYSSEISIDTALDHVRILDYKNMQGTIIENADVAKTFREIFEMIWSKY